MVLQKLFNLSDDEVEFQINDRRSFEEFVGLGVMNGIPDTTTVNFFRQHIQKSSVIDELFEMFESQIRDQGLEALGGEIIDATLVLVPQQRNSREDNKKKKANRLQDELNESLKRLQQKDLDARWVKKNDINHYGQKNSICIDAEHGFIRHFVITPKNIHDDDVWADSAYSGERFKDLLSFAGFENRIHEKGSRNHPLSAAATERNSIRSQIRARVEHVFGCFATSMENKFTRKIGIKRNKALWSLKFLHLISCATYII